MTDTTLTARYLSAWNAQDLPAIHATLGETGTYEDPSTRGPIRGEALSGYIEGLWAAFPDLRFETEGETVGEATVATQWLMRGTNTGAMNGLPPTGKSVELRGADVFTFGPGHIASVTGYFDTSAVPRQLGLNVIVQPPQIGPFRFGTSTVVQSGRTTAPGAFSITHLEARGPEEIAKVSEGSRASLMDMLEMEEFIGATTSGAGNRLVTITAWADADAPRRVMREGAHAKVMKAFYDGTLATAGRTTVWTLARDNGLMLRCESCGQMTRDPAPGDACRCGSDLPEPPPYW